MQDYSNFDLNLDKYESTVERIEPMKFVGRIIKVSELFVEADGLKAKLGEICKITKTADNTQHEMLAEVVDIRPDIGQEKSVVKLMCYEDTNGISVGDRVEASGEMLSIYVGEQLLGRIVDGIGKDYDGYGGIGSTHYTSVFNKPFDAYKRKMITEPLATGVKAIDGMITIGKGQRIGIFAGSSVGKSTLLGMIARNTQADVNVVALIGERGRELREFVERDLGLEGLKKSVIVFASSDKSPLYKVRAADTATTIAEYFRDQGKDVLLMMDSVTRFAMAQREIGLANGEPPSQKGYTPSVFNLLPTLFERAGISDVGTITGIYTVLVDGDDMNEPISDAVRSIIDGHIVLDRKLAHKNHYPAIDILASISRLASHITSDAQKEKVNLIRDLLAEYRDKEDMINIGMYVRGANKKTDMAIDLKEKIDNFLKQKVEESFTFDEVLAEMDAIFGSNEELFEYEEEKSIFD